MTQRRPELHDLVEGLSAEEAERLGNVHALLLAADPPPNVGTGLQPLPDLMEANRRARPRWQPRRRIAALVAAGAIVLAGVFAAGYAIGDRDPAVFRTVAMSGAGGVHVTLRVRDVDQAGNWPMDVRAEGLVQNVLYQVWLTRDGALSDPCGEFRVAPDGTAHVPLNAPYRLRDYDGWVVVRAGSTTPLAST